MASEWARRARACTFISSLDIVTAFLRWHVFIAFIHLQFWRYIIECVTVVTMRNRHLNEWSKQKNKTKKQTRNTCEPTNQQHLIGKNWSNWLCSWLRIETVKVIYICRLFPNAIGCCKWMRSIYIWLSYDMNGTLYSMEVSVFFFFLCEYWKDEQFWWHFFAGRKIHWKNSFEKLELIAWNYNVIKDEKEGFWNWNRSKVCCSYGWSVILLQIKNAHGN